MHMIEFRACVYNVRVTETMKLDNVLCNQLIMQKTSIQRPTNLIYAMLLSKRRQSFRLQLQKVLHQRMTPQVCNLSELVQIIPQKLRTPYDNMSHTTSKRLYVLLAMRKRYDLYLFRGQ
jgi:hypothetical protein